VFTFGFALFTVASFACGLSGDATVLNFARGVQGTGAAAMFATALALIAQEFEGRERGNAIGIWGATVGGAVAIGPLLGGLITEGLGWEWIFFVNDPIGIGAIILTETKLVNVKATDPQPIDWAGVVTFSAGLFLLIFGLIRGNPEGWGSAQIVASLGGAVVLLVAFMWIQFHRENAMLDLSLFRKPAFTGASIVALTLSAGMFAMFLYLTLYIQDVLGYSPLEAGVRFLPTTLLSFFVAPLAGRALSRIPAGRIMGTGLIFVGVGLLLQHGVEVGDSWTGLLPGFILTGIGVGMTNPPLASVAIGVVEPARAGMASGINSTFRQVGIATGTAVLGAIFQSGISSKLSEIAPQLPSSFADAVSSGAAHNAVQALPAQLQDQALNAGNIAFISAFNTILIVGAAIALAGSLASWVLIRGKDVEAVGHEAQGQPPAESQPEPVGAS
jgi:EmrB/QacA subfamily drug resistance transporter